jgi:hypothetical protein
VGTAAPILAERCAQCHIVRGVVVKGGQHGTASNLTLLAFVSHALGSGRGVTFVLIAKCSFLFCSHKEKVEAVACAMASTQVFTLLGVGDDVDLARAELLADLLTRVLPAFKYRKIVVRQEEWEGAMSN